MASVAAQSAMETAEEAAAAGIAMDLDAKDAGGEVQHEISGEHEDDLDLGDLDDDGHGTSTRSESRRGQTRAMAREMTSSLAFV